MPKCIACKLVNVAKEALKHPNRTTAVQVNSMLDKYFSKDVSAEDLAAFAISVQGCAAHGGGDALRSWIEGEYRKLLKELAATQYTAPRY